MIKTSIEKLASEIGYDIGNSDDIAQSNLLNGLARGLCNSMDEQNFHTQLAYIADKLDNKSKRLIKELYEFIKLQENEN
ncbi:hypothetical protein [Bacteroides reticulotermitis]|uniref:Uncharacterized protein n=2 Tax=Bacteroides reticulotermitis TaxID=1133319 RepID=W4UQC5_9BACE|nr:hypothetical protein [Bacteroides reticulotermitis]MBB4043869.1 putative DNA-binding ribbon-helix-helix protein [Bacteroides reticulotermitis]GAE83380.1 hypothetical protein JCM10512_1648 [Bacteroides reticulotermitis JCM 10512]